MRRPRGWSLPDTVVAVALASVVLVVVAQVLSSTSRLTRAQVQRSLQQTRLQAAALQVERTLLGCPSEGVSWQAGPTGAVLATHAHQSGSVVNTPRWDPFWRCFVWDASRGGLYLVHSPSPGATPTPSQTRPQAMAPTQMDALLEEIVLNATSLPARLLASRVTDFSYTLESGPLFRIEIEVDVPEYEKQEGTAANRLKAVKLIHPRL